MTSSRACRACMFLVVLLLGGCQAKPAPADSAALEQLLKLMQQRLLMMHDVARAKWNAKLPAADPEREKEILDQMVEKGKEKGLDPVFVQGFFEAQFDAAKRVQQANHDRWQETKPGSFQDAGDLKALRTILDQHNEKILNALVAVQPLLDKPEVRTALPRVAKTVITGDGIDADLQNAVTAPLRRQ